MYERTSGAIALMPSGNLEGSWYFYLLHNGQVVKRNKATSMPIMNDIIAYLNSKAVSRKGKIHHIDKQLFEMDNQHIPIDDYDEDIEFNAAGNDQPDVFHDIPIENLLDNNFGEEYPYEHNQDNHQLNDDINDNHVMDNNDINDNHIDNEITQSNVEPYDVVAQNNILNQVNHDDIADPHELNIRGDNQALLDDIFGIDSDDDNVVIEELDVASISEPDKYIQEPLYNVNNPRRSARNHKVRTIGINNSRKLDTFLSSDRLNYNSTKLRHDYMKRSFGLNMTVSQGIKKLGYEAIYSVVKEMIQMCDRNVITGVKFENLNKDQISGIITSRKARLVAAGHLQDREINDKGTSPTVSIAVYF